MKNPTTSAAVTSFDVFDALEIVSRRWLARGWPESTRRPVPCASDSD